MDGVTESYLVRLGPPATGDMIHVSTCRYARQGNALHWEYPEREAWQPAKTPWLRMCKLCHPETHPLAMRAAPDDREPVDA